VRRINRAEGNFPRDILVEAISALGSNGYEGLNVGPPIASRELLVNLHQGIVYRVQRSLERHAGLDLSLNFVAGPG
jgi:hypothetical protein